MFVKIAAKQDPIKTEECAGGCLSVYPEFRLWIHAEDGEYHLNFDTWADAVTASDFIVGAEKVPVIVYNGFELDITRISELKDISERKK